MLGVRGLGHTRCRAYYTLSTRFGSSKARHAYTNNAVGSAAYPVSVVGASAVRSREGSGPYRSCTGAHYVARRSLRWRRCMGCRTQGTGRDRIACQGRRWTSDSVPSNLQTGGTQGWLFKNRAQQIIEYSAHPELGSRRELAVLPDSLQSVPRNRNSDSSRDADLNISN